MIQRKQSLYLLLAFVALVVCLTLPIGRFIVPEEGCGIVLYNASQFIVDKENVKLQVLPLSSIAPLALLLLFSCPLIIWTIFKYNQRKLQAKLTVVLAFAMVAWIAYLACLGFVIGLKGCTFQPAVGAALPIVAFILIIMARRGILADEALVRAADRIR